MYYLAQQTQQLDFWQELIEQNDVIPFVAIVMGCTIAIVAIVFGSLKSIFVARAREATKREMAAYVAEGSLDPEKAVAMLNAGRTKSCGEA